MNLANKLTVSRIFLTFIFMFFLFQEGLAAKIVAFLVFIAASLTDYFDGFLAKKMNQITDFGKFMDPVADKILVISAFLAFIEMKLVPAWLVVIIVFREFIITGLRLIALAKGEVIQAEAIGKHKTVSQMLAIYLVLIFIIFKESGQNAFGFWNEKLEYAFKDAIFYLMVITAALTLISGISYIVKNKRFFTHAKIR